MNLLGLLNSLIGPIWEGVKALFLIRHGKQKQELKQKKQEVRNAKLAAKRKADIDELPINDLDDLV